MKVIHAFWEKVNFGLDAYDITLDDDLTENDKFIESTIFSKKFSSSYLTVKVPIPQIKIVHKLEAMNFNLMELQFKLTYINNKRLIIPDPSVRQVCNNFSGSTFETIINQLSRKTFFLDRISLDPALPDSASIKRYQNWIKSLSNCSSAQLFSYYKSDNCIGFILVKKDDLSYNIINEILICIFNKFKFCGLGKTILALFLNETLKTKNSKIITFVSSNNLASLKLHTKFQYEIENEYYVLRRYPIIKA